MTLKDAAGIEMLQETLDEEDGMEQRLAQLMAAGGPLTSGRARTMSY